jgi:O-antigen/teichoic acid export membrane protein
MFLKKILSNEFNKSVVTLLTGTAVAQALPIAVSPILTRMYSPADFGVVSLFMTITVIFGTIANAKYELAIVVPEKDEDAINLSALSFVISTALSVFLLLVVLLFKDMIVHLLKAKEIGPWLYFVPLVVFITGLYNMLNYLNTRFKNYTDISRSNIYQAVALCVFQVGLGFLKVGASGLFIGQIASTLFGNGRLLKNIILKKRELLKEIQVSEMKRLAVEYSEYPKYSLGGSLANTISSNVNNILIATIYSVATLGFYSFVQRILITPIRLIGNSIGQVFFQKASVEANEKGNAEAAFNETLKKLLVIGVPGFTLMFFIINPLITLVFGEKWQIAGEYAQILTPLFLLRFIVVPLSLTIPIFKQNKFGLIWQIGTVVINLAAFGICYFYKFDAKTFIYIYSITQTVYYVYYFIKLKGFSKGNNSQNRKVQEE